MEFKGTSGKWSIYQRIDDNEENQYSVTSNNGKVCYCYNMSISDYENNIAKANALLISKSPEMLEMLKDSVEVIKWYMENSTTELHEPFFNIGANQIEQTEQLIKEATEL